MLSPRVMPDAVLLPDGKVLVVGGSSKGHAGNAAADPVLFAEIYDTTTEKFSGLCSMNTPRVYHATAILLPDARVLMMGKDRPLNSPPYDYPEYRAEFFSPPYLFAGTRPTIAAVPSTANYNSNFNISTNDASSIQSVALLRPSSLTHSNNMGQRYVGLTIISRRSFSLAVQSPPNGNIAPPGDYMLFIVNGLGVPSVAKFIRMAA